MPARSSKRVISLACTLASPALQTNDGVSTVVTGSSVVALRSRCDRNFGPVVAFPDRVDEDNLLGYRHEGYAAEQPGTVWLLLQVSTTGPSLPEGRPSRPLDDSSCCATNSIMTTVGVRELRQRASELLRLVEQGETVEITDRGRPVALLGPVPKGPPLERLRASGEGESGTIDLDDLPAPLVLPAGVEPPSVVLARLRSDER